MKKSNLSAKDCVVCGRGFNWRKKWRNDWPEVKYCSKRCQKLSKLRKPLKSGVTSKER